MCLKIVRPGVSVGQWRHILLTVYSHLRFRMGMVLWIPASFTGSQGRDDVSKITQRDKARN
jgi:hypothetical protein